MNQARPVPARAHSDLTRFARERVQHAARLLSVVLCLFCASFTSAQVLTVDPTDEQAPPLSGLRTSSGVLELDLQEAVRVAMQRNLSLRIDELELLQYGQIERGASGAFDPQFTSHLSASEDTNPATSSLDGAAVLTQRDRRFRMQLDKANRVGGNYGLIVEEVEVESNSAFNLFSSYDTLNTDVFYRHQFLRNGGRFGARRELLVSRLRNDQAVEEMRTSIRELLLDVEFAYWDLVERRARLEVARESFDLAEDLFVFARAQVEAGALPSFHLAQSRVALANRAEAIAQAELDLRKAEDALRLLLNFEEGPLWKVEIIPLSEPVVEAWEFDVYEAITLAESNRSEIKALASQVERRALESNYFRSQTRPELEFVATYGFNGIGGDRILLDEEGLVTGVQQGGLTMLLKMCSTHSSMAFR